MMKMTPKAERPIQTYERGRQYRVIKGGAQLSGVVPKPGYRIGDSVPLSVGDVITCDGKYNGFGSDPGYYMHFHSDTTLNKGMADVHFVPCWNLIWDGTPLDGYLEPINQEEKLT